MKTSLRVIKAGIAVPFLAACFSLPVFAEDVTFTTTGEFLCGTAVGCSTSNGGSNISITNNGNTVMIAAIGEMNPNVLAGEVPNDDVNVIQFHITSTNNTPPPNSPQNFGLVNTAGADFTLFFNQTAPTTESGQLNGVFSGSLDAKASNAAISFSNDTLVLGNVTYQLDSDIWSLPNSGIKLIGVTTETANVTPEPTFILLTGFGFGGLLLLAYLRRQKAHLAL